MDKPALESGNLSGRSLRREVSGENFRLEADSWQGAGTGAGGSGEAWYWGCRLQLPHSPRGWSFTPLRSPPCIQDPPSPLSPEATQGNSPLRIVTRFSGLTGDFGNQVKDKSETELPDGGMPMDLSAKWVSGRSIAAALQARLTMDRPPSGTPSPVIKRIKQRKMQVQQSER